MIHKTLLLTASLLLSFSQVTLAAERYQSRPPVIVSPDLTAPWVMQLGGAATRPVVYANPQPAQRVYQRQVIRRGQATRPLVQQAVTGRTNAPVRSQIEPMFLPQMVSYETKHRPGTIVIDTNNRFLYLVMENGQARRYGVGVGKPGFEWAGAHKVTRKAEWPNWTPPKEMIAREAAKGHYLPTHMAGGPENPLGARALYLGSTLYRIHGTNAPWTIGSGVSSGCIRMRNEDVVDLYERVKVGTTVIVI
ncbi:L,D-transpeptidase [Rhizobium sp. CG5]|uniref:L,D-transpeptidase n=1 Tax=Rhizobium sp. CG5 TaxID=2726076 RepID=UPI0020337B76|nr:L,D-transpeptidase [Rhizobium sp. CG5]MCM2472949.1 L,D-transpeptidase [Rhizobium sp. CG5]